jgi:hypothetical protein
MVDPCDKYQALVVGPDGQTVTDPFGILPTLADYEEWRGVADVLIQRADAEVSTYFEEHGAPPEEIWQPVEALRVRWDNMGTAVEQAFQLDDLTWGSDIVAMVEIARDAACQIGVVEAARVELGGMESDIPTQPKPSSGGGSSSKGTGKGMGLGLVLLVAGLAIFGDRR